MTGGDFFDAQHHRQIIQAGAAPAFRTTMPMTPSSASSAGAARGRSGYAPIRRRWAPAAPARSAVKVSRIISCSGENHRSVLLGMRKLFAPCRMAPSGG